MTILSHYNSPFLKTKRIDLLSDINKELDHIFNEMFNGQYFVNKKNKGYPLVDVIRQENSLILQFTVPGVKLEDIRVNINDSDEGKILEISGQLSDEYSSFKDENYHIRELSSQGFRRVIRLPDDIKDCEPLAVLRHGILTLTFEIIKTVEPKTNIREIKIIQG